MGLAAFGFWWSARGGEKQHLVRIVEEVLDAARVNPDETPGKRDQRLQTVLDSHFEDPVTLRYADLPHAGAGRRALLIWGRLLLSYGPARLGAEQVQVGLSDDGRAGTVRCSVQLEGERQGQGVVEQRVVEFRLRNHSGVWKIQSVEVQPGANDVPEARP